MNCKNCSEHLSHNEIVIEINSTDIEIIYHCPNCGEAYGTTITNSDLEKI